MTSLLGTAFCINSPVMWSFDVFCVDCLNKLLNNLQSICHWFEMPWCSCDFCDSDMIRFLSNYFIAGFEGLGNQGRFSEYNISVVTHIGNLSMPLLPSDWGAWRLAALWQPLGEGSPWVHHPSELLWSRGAHREGCQMGGRTGQHLCLYLQ